MTYCLCSIACGRPIYLNLNNLKQIKYQHQLGIFCYCMLLQSLRLHMLCLVKTIHRVRTAMLTSPSMISVSSFMRTPIALRNACQSIKKSALNIIKLACLVHCPDQEFSVKARHAYIPVLELLFLTFPRRISLMQPSLQMVLTPPRLLPSPLLLLFYPCQVDQQEGQLCQQFCLP